jgi:hypothetical protein
VLLGLVLVGLVLLLLVLLLILLVLLVLLVLLLVLLLLLHVLHLLLQFRLLVLVDEGGVVVVAAVALSRLKPQVLKQFCDHDPSLVGQINWADELGQRRSDGEEEARAHTLEDLLCDVEWSGVE